MDPAQLLAVATDRSLTPSDRLAAAGRLRNWIDGLLLDLSAEVADRGELPETKLVQSGRVSGRSAQRDMRRAGVLDEAPGLRDALSAGTVSVDHVDALGRGLAKLDEQRRGDLLDDTLLDAAQGATPERFDQLVRNRVKELLSEDDLETTLARQRRTTRLHTWVDSTTGMWCVRGQFDGETGVRLQTLLDTRHDQLFAQQVPATAPDDPLERAAHLRALALVDLLDQPDGGLRPEVLVAIRADGRGGYEVEWRLPVELPRSVLLKLLSDPNTLITPIIVQDGLVLHAPGELNLGRRTRLASRAQRRALQAIYPTCRVEGCDVPFHRCDIHHRIPWEDDGPTDFENLEPLCARHHTQHHQGLLDLPPPAHRAA